MPSSEKKKELRILIFTFAFAFFLLFILMSFYNKWLGMTGVLIEVLFLVLFIAGERKFTEKLKEDISTLSYRVKSTGEKIVMNLPFGVMFIDEDLFIQWANPYLEKLFQEEDLSGKSLYDLVDELIPIIKQEKQSGTIALFDKQFRIYYQKEDQLVFFFDITDFARLKEKYQAEKPVLAIIYLDNYDEVTQGMDDEARGSLNSQVTSILNDWAKQFGVFIKRINSERFIAFLNEKILHELEDDKFSILDTVREAMAEQDIPLTLSIGVGIAAETLPELGDLAQSSLDLALGRGGDQVAIKLPEGKVRFYGGKTNPVEKRTRVRARVISHALGELMEESRLVLIMGHRYPDMDAVGSSIGLLKIAKIHQPNAFVVLNEDELDRSVERLLEYVKQKPEIYRHFISAEQALDLDLRNALLVIVDTHKPSFCIEERLVEKIDRIVVIDHHRRSEEFVQNPLLVYMEPYASSTSELVTELLEYQPIEKIDMIEATALLAGIIVDTKSFTLRTGSRTFDAASFLRSRGADTILVQNLLKGDLKTFIQKSKIIENVDFYRDGIAIAKANEDEMTSQILLAQTADTLLTMENVLASFVIGRKSDGTVGISARSLGHVNVQLIMELLHGGGHLTNAATELEDVTIDEAERMLKQAIDEYFEGGKTG
ncbi:MAG: DHH family phosphoesterase [Caldibacillus sp.]